MDDQPDSVDVDAQRLGRAQRFALTASVDGVVLPGRWGVVQWAAKPRVSRGEFAPWWYTEGLTWHLYEGEPPVPDGELPPPKASFASMQDAKERVRALAAEAAGE
ncbi:hypothetical protein [Streptomyces longwoodensis]|uniref:hypothetical protein n=1 Tax=Streptomyces longwoodensis TaxID=68231 RepID=UPI0036FEFB2D